ncbi:hypothetical protein Tco_1091814 [Tanacetum coccineum]|uniref:Uncharacterized protein n=1 Tax=Tanacetum coccineum TaxID=301880 RepID=A0ABQ5I9A2_9ASTR
MCHSRRICYFPRLRQDKDNFLTLKNTLYAVPSLVSAACCTAAGYFAYCCCLLCSCCSSILLPPADLSRNLELTESTPSLGEDFIPADSLNSIPADNVPAGRSSSIPADYVSAGLVLVPADSDRIC